MGLVGFFLDALSFFSGFNGPESSQVQLYTENKDEVSLSKLYKASFPDLTLKPLPSTIKPKVGKGIGSSLFKIVSIEEEKPFSMGFQLGVVILMRSSTHIGIARIIRDIQPFKTALLEMNMLSKKKIELFILDGTSCDEVLYKQALQFIRAFNRIYSSKVVLESDLFRTADTHLLDSPCALGLKLVGFDEENKPIAVVGYVHESLSL